jgi:polyisoprenyl-teichoic acid--peptidoglycan teichoic acid transferase
LIAATLSLVVPGAGHWFLGRRRAALPFFFLTAALAAVAVLVWLQGTIFALHLLVQPRWVWALIVGNVFVGAVRLWAALDAYAVASGVSRRLPVLAVAGVSVALGIILFVPHVVVGSKAASLLDLLDVFVADERGARRIGVAQPRIPGSPVVDETTWPSLPDLSDDRPPTPPVFAPLPEPVVAPEDVDRITLLLVGGDAGPERGGLRTDSMIVASLDTRTNRAVLITVSRELVGFPVPARVRDVTPLVDRQRHLWNLWLLAEERGTSRATIELPDPPPEDPDPDVWLDRVNAIYPVTRSATWAYPGAVSPGLEALRRSLSQGLGIVIDYYLMVDMGGFVDVIDAVGGVRVTSRETMNIFISPAKEGEEWYEIDIEPGTQHMSGRTALAYVRNRIGSSDLVRTRRQRCFVREVTGQFDSTTVLRRFEAISAAVRRHTTTDLPLRFLPTLVTAVGSLNRSDVATLAIDQVSASTERDYRGLPIVDLSRARRLVRDAFDGLGDPEAEVVAEC